MEILRCESVVLSLSWGFLEFAGCLGDGLVLFPRLELVVPAYVDTCLKMHRDLAATGAGYQSNAQQALDVCREHLTGTRSPRLCV